MISFCCSDRFGLSASMGIRFIPSRDDQIDSFKELSKWIFDSNYHELFSEILETEKVLEEAKRWLLMWK